MTIPTFITERFRRAGLRAEYDLDVWHYEPDGVFFVDGIRYAFAGCLRRSIIEVIPPHECASARCTTGARMIFSQPLADAQLDRWVKTGRLIHLRPGGF